MENNDILTAGFRSVSQAKRFAKFYSLLMIYQNGQVNCDTEAKAAMVVTELNRKWAYKELIKMRLPSGFCSLSAFSDALKWFLKNCR